MVESELKRYFLIFRKRMRLIVFIIFIFTLTSSVLSIYVLKPKYQSVATLLADKPQIYDENSIITYKEIVLSASVLEEVIRSLGLNISYEKLKKKIDVVIVKNTKIIKIIVQDQNKKNAVQMANKIAKTAMEHINKITREQSIRILDRAEISTQKVKPLPVFYIPVASVAGLLIGLFAVSFFEYWDNTFKSITDIERCLGIPVVGMFLKSYPDRGGAKNKNSKMISLHEKPHSLKSEAYRELRANIQFLAKAQDLKSIVITSSVGKEGKSDIAVNLAAALAKIGERVLLIDANLRNPECHKYFGEENDPGVLDILLGKRSFEETIRFTNIRNLDLLPAGEKVLGFAELLSSQLMAELIEMAKTEYDRIIVDTSSVEEGADAAVLSALCDGVLFVCEVERIPIWKVCKSKIALDKICGNMIGVVLNRISSGNQDILYYR